jgi:hypothetical protein
VSILYLEGDEKEERRKENEPPVGPIQATIKEPAAGVGGVLPTPQYCVKSIPRRKALRQVLDAGGVGSTKH